MAPQRGFPACSREVPWSDNLTDYDREHLTLYVRLLDATQAGMPDAEICRALLGWDMSADPDGAAQALQSHLRRAQWMTEHGYRKLLPGSD